MLCQKNVVSQKILGKKIVTSKKCCEQKSLTSKNYIICASFRHGAFLIWQLFYVSFIFFSLFLFYQPMYVCHGKKKLKK